MTRVIFQKTIAWAPLVLLGLDYGYLAAATRDTEIEKAETSYRVNGDNTGEIRYHQRWRSLTAQGRKEISRIQIPYVPSLQDVEIKSITTFKKDGTVVNGDPSSAFDADGSNDPLTPYFTDSRLKIFLPPSVETGDAIEYEAVIHVHRWLKPGDFWLSHPLSSGTVETVVLDMPADRKVSLYENSRFPGKTETVEGRRIERWETSKSGEDESDLPLFSVSSIPSWDAFGAWIRSLNQRAIEPTPEITTLAARLTAGKTSERDRIAALYTYVATKVRYVAVEFGIGRLQPHTAGDVLRNSYGDCKDQTALLSALLTAAGFKAHPVLTTPFAGVQLQQVPTPENFSHEFTAVETGSGLIFLDSSMGLVPPQVLAPGVRGKTALVVGNEISSVIEIPNPSPVPARIEMAVKGAVSAAGVFEGSVRMESEGLMELVFRRMFFDVTAEDKEKTLGSLLSAELQGSSIRQITHGDPADLGKPFWLQFEVSDPTFFPTSKTSMRVDLGMSAVLPQSSKSAKKPVKPFPIDAFSIKFNMDLAVNSAFILGNGMPVHRKIAAASYDSEFTYQNGHQLLTRTLVFNGTPVTPEDWEKLLEFERAIREEHGFTLERRPASPATAGSSALTTAMRNGSAALQRRDYEAAKNAYLEVTRLDPLSRTAWNELGRAYATLREYDKAETAYKRQIEINPKDPYSYNNLGLVYRSLKRDDEAIEMYRKQIEINPRDRFAHDNLGMVLATKGRWEEAAAEEAIATEVSPEDPTRWYRLGRARIHAGHVEDGGNAFEHALALTHDAGIENNIAYEMANAGYKLDQARQLIFGTLEPEARRVCEPETISKDDKCATQLRRISTWLDTAGWVLYRDGKVKEAEPYIWSAWAITQRAEVAMHLSLILAHSGRVDEAVKFFADARSRTDFAALDPAETRKDLASVLGGEGQLDSRLKQIEGLPDAASAKTRVTALVDASGKVLNVQAADAQTPEAAVFEAKSLTLTPISWPDHSIRSIRTIEFRQDGEKWVVSQSYVGQAPDSAR